MHWKEEDSICQFKATSQVTLLLTGIVLLSCFATGRWRISEAKDPLVLDAQHSTSHASIEFVVFPPEQVVGRKVLDDEFHDLCGSLRGTSDAIN